MRNLTYASITVLTNAMTPTLVMTSEKQTNISFFVYVLASVDEFFHFLFTCANG